MKLIPKIGTLPSNIIVAIYLMATLYVRFVIEPQFNNSFIASIAIGAFMLLFLWAMIRIRLLNPSFYHYETSIGRESELKKD